MRCSHTSRPTQGSRLGSLSGLSAKLCVCLLIWDSQSFGACEEILMASSSGHWAGRDVSREKHLIAGTVAGSVTTIVLYPLDLIKVRYQIYEGKGSAYSSIAGAFRTILSREGSSGLYQVNYTRCTRLVGIIIDVIFCFTIQGYNSCGNRFGCLLGWLLLFL